MGKESSLKPNGILVVAEDDPDMRLLLCQVFRRDGFHVVPVDDGRELIRYVEDCREPGSPLKPRVVVSDNKMPGLTGLEVLTRLAPGDAPLIVITAFGDASTHSEALRLGAAAVLDKPVDIDVLRATVRRIAGVR
jgi:DNA-binding response OmpR family regulator